MMVRSDHLGVTSVIRELILDPASYECMLNFLHASSWSLEKVRSRWYEILRDSGVIYRVNGRAVIVGDGVKQSKEGFYIPGTKKLHQESEDSSKAEYIYGHLFGAVGVVIGTKLKHFCVPLKINIQDGLRAASSWNGSGISSSTHVVQMIESGGEVSKILGPVIYLLDRYFLSVPALKRLSDINSDGGDIVIVTKAKINCRAYEKPVVKPGAKGRKPKKGKKHVLENYFKHGKFLSAKASMYGKDNQDVQYCCKNFLWGNGLYQELRFVMVKYNGMKSILVTTDTNMDPITVIELYSQRFSIENFFREYKQQAGGFGYHFWTKHISKLNHYAKTTEPDRLEKVTNENSRQRILATIKAIEGFVLFGSISFGIIQMIALDETVDGEVSQGRYLRTRSQIKVSEATVRRFLQKKLFALMMLHPTSLITINIRKHQKVESGSYISENSNVA